jgi:RNA polymerase sigma factor (sigma-70 family)
MEMNVNLSEKAKVDVALVERALGNDQKAFEKLMNKYRESIYFLVLKMVRNTDDADDVMIEVFSKAFTNLHQYVPNYAFSTWLYKIASNHCIDFIRKQKKKLVSIDQGFDALDSEDHYTIQLEADSYSPFEIVDREQRAQIIKKYVSSLKPRYRQLVEMRYFDEMSYQEISEELGLPVGTVKAQLFRSREYLLAMLQETEIAI